jgi:hypothetical protein
MLSFSTKNFFHYLQYLADGLLGWGLGLVIDYHYYGSQKIPPVNWVKFNLIENRADVFSIDRWDYYISEVIILDGLGPFVVFNLFLLSFVVSSTYADKSFFYNDNKLIIRSYVKQFFVVSFIWLVYTSFWRDMTLDGLIELFLTGNSWDPMSHKEVRFVMGGLLLLLVFLATGFQIAILLIIRVVSWITFDLRKIKFDKHIFGEIKYWTNLIVPAIVILLIVTTSFSSAANRQYIEQFADVNLALSYVGHQDNVTGVIVGVNWYQAGSYTYSHLSSDVPIVFVNFWGSSVTNNEANKKVMVTYANDLTYNYFIAPDYQFFAYPELTSILLSNGWDLVQVVEGKVDVWKRT